MPFDAIFLTAVAQELRSQVVGARVDKIQQPARDMVLLTLRGKEKLLLSANGSRPRIQLTKASYENPAQPPMFCMLLRKHLSGGRIAALRQPMAERCIEIAFDCTDEMGEPCRKSLILELMGRNSNLILTDGEGRILDCIRRVDLEMSQLRQVLPGLYYHEPPKQNKIIPQNAYLSDICAYLSDIDSSTHLDQWLLDRFSGISPLIARELSYRFSGETDADLLTLDKAALADYLVKEFRFSEQKPVLLRKQGKPSDISYRQILQYGNLIETEEFPSYSELLDAFYTQTDHSERMRQKSQTLRKTVTTLRDRAVRKLNLQRKEFASTLDRESLRRQGDIVTANLHAIERGQTLLRAVNFYDPEMSEIEISLKPNLSPQQNAARFYKEYAKAKHAEKVLSDQIAQGEIEAAYLSSVLDALSRAENERDLSEIRAELEGGGYLRPTDSKKQKKLPPSKPMEFTSSDGYRIFVGRNNRQNDLLTLKTARKDDLWLHVQKFHGAHVVIDCHGTTPPDETITEAAELAAWFSEAKEGQNVPVDLTPVRQLKKPNGAKPGMVIYDRYRTVIVTPQADLVDRLAARNGGTA